MNRPLVRIGAVVAALAICAVPVVVSAWSARTHPDEATRTGRPSVAPQGADGPREPRHGTATDGVERAADGGAREVAGARSKHTGTLDPSVMPPDLLTRVRKQLETATGDGLAAVRDALVELELADDALLAALEDHCGIESSDIPLGISVLDHAAAVARVGARGIATETDFYDDDFESRFPERIDFAVAVDEENAAVDPATEFQPGVRRIYASFASKPGIGRDVLVKWTHLDQGRIHLYRKTPLERGADVDYVWLQMLEDWGSGAYAVEVYSLRRNLAPVAGGRYFVR